MAHTTSELGDFRIPSHSNSESEVYQNLRIFKFPHSSIMSSLLIAHYLLILYIKHSTHLKKFLVAWNGSVSLVSTLSLYLRLHCYGEWKYLQWSSFWTKPLPRNDEKFCLIRYTEWSSFSGPYNEMHRKFHHRMHYSCQNLICFVSIHFVICTCWKRNHNLNIVWQSTWEDLSLFGYTGFIDLGRIYKNLS